MPHPLGRPYLPLTHSSSLILDPFEYRKQLQEERRQHHRDRKAQRMEQNRHAMQEKVAAHQEKEAATLQMFRQMLDRSQGSPSIPPRDPPPS